LNWFRVRILAGVTTFAAISTPAATVFDFDNLAVTPVPLTNQYASSGVLFGNIEAATSFIFNIVPPSSPVYASPFWTSTNPGTLSFVDPTDSGTPAITDSVTITMVGLSTPAGHPGQYSGATIDALDAFGNVIAGQTQIIPGTSIATSNLDLTFTGPIHSLRFTHTAGTNGTLPFDNLTFGALTDVPETSTTLLVSGALAGLVLLRRRASAQLCFVSCASRRSR